MFFFGIWTAGSFLQQLACIFISKCSLYRKAGFAITSQTSIQFTSIAFFLTLSNPPPLLPFLHPHLQERSPHFSYDTPCPWDFSLWEWLISLCVMVRTWRKETRRITPFKHAWRNDQGTYDLYSGDQWALKRGMLEDMWVLKERPLVFMKKQNIFRVATVSNMAYKCSADLYTMYINPHRIPITLFTEREKALKFVCKYKRPHLSSGTLSGVDDQCPRGHSTDVHRYSVVLCNSSVSESGDMTTICDLQRRAFEPRPDSSLCASVLSSVGMEI